MLNLENMNDFLEDMALNAIVAEVEKVEKGEGRQIPIPEGISYSHYTLDLLEVLQSKVLPYGFKAYGYPLEIMFFEGGKRNKLKIKRNSEVFDLAEWIMETGIEEVEKIKWISNLEKQITIINDEFYLDRTFENKYQLLDEVFVTKEEMVYVQDVDVGYTFYNVTIDDYLTKLVKHLKTY